MRGGNSHPQSGAKKQQQKKKRAIPLIVIWLLILFSLVRLGPWKQNKALEKKKPEREKLLWMQERKTEFLLSLLVVASWFERPKVQLNSFDYLISVMQIRRPGNRRGRVCVSPCVPSRQKRLRCATFISFKCESAALAAGTEPRPCKGVWQQPLFTSSGSFSRLPPTSPRIKPADGIQHQVSRPTDMRSSRARQDG